MNLVEVYRMLSAQYGWTPNEIANMTPAQQTMYLDQAKSGTQGFATLGEARQFVEALKGSG